MTQILDPIPLSANSDSFLCCYVNATSQMQIVRITNIPHWYFERVVFPGQRLVFKAFPEALLEIHCGMMATAILSDTIPCEDIRVYKTIFGEVNMSQEAATAIAAQKLDENTQKQQLVCVN
ncbi:MAG: DUF1830 domain-containing protein [Prochloron sp. SP5CPC1]|nr:DUF1830 domain-containing protein [Candidatus Paraprochloron terpiosi SP5CPC1]